MELSSENIEELARAMTATSRCIAQQDGVFQTKSDFSAIDVDRVISDAQDSLLNTSMEAIRSCNVPCSFNDILDDICKMNNNIELQQAALNTSIPQQLPPEPPAFYHMPDLEIQSEDYTSQCNFSNQNEFLQPLSQWSEYLPLPPSALSSIQDIPQLAPIPATPPTPPPPQPVPVVMQKIPDSKEVPADNANPIIEESKQESTAPGTPVQFFNNYHFTIPPSMMHPQSMQQNDVPNCNIQFSQVPETNINFMMLQEQPMGASNIRIQQQQPFLDWARVIPRRAFLQSSEVVVLRPLRTRKVISTRPSFDLASYFDTSTISIPMIKERPRCKANRRKQKLYTIPRADNLVFEVQLVPSEEGRDDNNNKEDQMYPETEIPELDEFFKRKRRTLYTRRKPPNQDSIKTLSPTLPVEEPKDDEIEDTPSPEKQPESYSDVDSDDAPLTIVKSMKCLNCKKIFKTCRSLTIHSKRCKIVPKSPEKQEELPEVVSPKTKLTRKATLQNNDNSQDKDNANVKKDCGVGRVVTRSLTRLQTRNAAKHKATEDDDGNGASNPKRSK